MKTVVLTRKKQNEIQTLGIGEVYDPANGFIFQCKTLELPWKNNQQNISRIPSNSYLIVKHISPKHGKSLWVKNVPNREEILIHKGNFYTDILGCILVGSDLVDINNDGHLDVTDSKRTMDRLYGVLDNENHLNIIEEWERNY